MKKYNLLGLLILSAFWINVTGNINLPAIFSNHMVLQQNSEVSIWGWARPNEQVSVTGSWDGVEVKTLGDNHANWKVILNTPKAGGPYSITIKGYNTVVINDVLIGEVWLCSGQSNMEWTPGAGIVNGNEEIKKANYPNIRFFSVVNRSADCPQQDVSGNWQGCNPETMVNFSAIAYFFGKKIHDSLNVPIGLINSSWGGTPAETWVNANVISKDAELAKAATALSEVPWCPVNPGAAYNAMIAPVIPYNLAGVLWYQGESNTANPDTYIKLFPALIQSWRHKWGKDFPFYYVQIAPYEYGTPNAGVMVMDAQRLSMSVPNTGMVVINDIGNVKDIHPRNKIDVGYRLANWALAKTYGKKDIVFSGPLFNEQKIDGNKIQLIFDYAQNGLKTDGQPLKDFQIAGEDQVFYEAIAKIKGNTVIVQSPKVKKPVAVRFAWSNTAEPNLFNTEGLPASCFRTDNWEMKYK